ncbi:metallophosphoesterase family protein [Facklamia miroungae]|uniref:DNA repair exonuclease SbcCD nuclease subunit n=1 Tax=Facklamia miroungae TaxID=120956 RepID=A0A1G7QUI8_9LACT|nr:DNA repair exonuclease [Facklamia miroungae]NKZ29069.1 DNA repair exonuclease [Facklamia miroungae]SDG02134.1 DNA repair exonuclease SbcCD nuclease subunit [Facklamia miroungae]
MRFMHFADLHLDSPFAGMQKQYPSLQEVLIQAPYKAFHRGVSYAIKEGVDAVIIAGDIYDTQKQTIYAQHAFLKELERLERAEIPVVICHGNHDYLNNQRLFVQYPANVYVFREESIDYIDIKTAEDITCRFYGFSYSHRWIHESKAKEFPINPKETDFTVGVYHGELLGQNQIGNYAPFTIDDLSSKNYDYWALGHIHQGIRLSQFPLIQYAGSPQGRNRLETGEKGAYIVTFNEDRNVDSEFIHLAEIEWKDEKIECQENWQINELLWAINDLVDNYKDEVDKGLPSKIISLTLTNAQRLPIDLQEQIEKGEIETILTEPQSTEQFAIIVRVKLERQMVLDAFEYDQTLKASFKEACLEMAKGSAYKESLEEMFDHPVIKQRMPDLISDEELKKETIQSAKELMIQAIGFEFKEAVELED